ncbi:unnamed protein product [Linum tenue]|uniref:RNA polymerase Rpb4/RPC9 core domain-containing protein n=1 Tax=Linum tenue TaxID=586396 RepID=A0AAV0GNG8_9ROSI|nr:unnamed protein product [Linum tenue]
MEKNGKGFSMPKSSLKSTPSKDDSSQKSKEGRKVQFNNGGSPEERFDYSKSNGKSSSSADKGGRGNTANVKASKSKEKEPLELRLNQELLKNAKCLMDCEAAEIIQGIQDQMTLLSQDATIKLPVSFHKGLQYSQANARYTNTHSVRRVLDTLKKHGVVEGEERHKPLNMFSLILWMQISVIANACPESTEEVFALVPSLKSKKSILQEPLEVALMVIKPLRKVDSTSV